MGAEYCHQFMSLSVCLSVCPRAYLWNHWTDLHKIICAYHLWPCLSPSPAALRYVMYFQFYGWHQPHHISLISDTGAESDVYECLVECVSR